VPVQVQELVLVLELPLQVQEQPPELQQKQPGLPVLGSNA
jgi:hypothetical protein